MRVVENWRKGRRSRLLLGFEWRYRLYGECRSHLACREFEDEVESESGEVGKKEREGVCVARSRRTRA